uniref:Uncharacterized protein n=1 Tax=Faecalibaculum rodentium TaxID=1702221 RepID=A0A140DTY0_9FIRM|nr:hypothetical protein AALO17_09730 [Faecalibaculum rodentium]
MIFRIPHSPLFCQSLIAAASRLHPADEQKAVASNEVILL